MTKKILTFLIIYSFIFIPVVADTITAVANQAIAPTADDTITAEDSAVAGAGVGIYVSDVTGVTINNAFDISVTSTGTVNPYGIGSVYSSATTTIDSLINSGNITSTTSGSVAGDGNSYGVFNSRGTITVFNNSGAILGTSSGYGTARGVNNTSGTITTFTNSGTITGTGTITATGPAGTNRTHPHLLTAPEIPIHSHTTPGSTGTDGSHNHSYSSHATAPDVSGFSAPSGRDRTNPATDPLQTNGIAAHNHPVSIASQGGNGAHSHSWTFVSAPLSTSLDLRVKYLDLLVCSLN